MRPIFPFVLLLALAMPAYAQSETHRAAADKLVQDGLQLARAKKYREAITRFEEAFKLYPHPEIQHNLGRAHEELGELVRAYDYFSQAQQAPYTFSAQGRERLTFLERELRKTHARVTVRTTPSLCRVVLSYPDGTEETRATTPFAAWAPAGRTRLTASNPSFKTAEQTLELEPGEDRDVNVTLSPVPRQGFLQVTVNVVGAAVSLAGKPVGVSPVPSLATDAGIYELVVTMRGYKPYRESVVVAEDQVSSVNVILAPESPDEPPHIDTGSSNWPGWVFIGAGAAAGGAAVYLQLGEAIKWADKANALDPDPKYDAEYDRLIGKAKDFQTAAIITGAVGGALVATGIILLVTHEDSAGPAASSFFVPSVAVSPDGAYLGGQFSF